MNNEQFTEIESLIDSTLELINAEKESDETFDSQRILSMKIKQSFFVLH